MKKISIENIEAKCLFCNIYGYTQKWTHMESYNFIGNHRVDHGFMYVACDELHLEYKDKSREIFYKGNLLYIPKYSEYYVEFWSTKSEFSDLLVNFDMCGLSGQEFCFFDKITCLMSETSPKIIDDLYTISRFCKSIKNPYLQNSKIFYDLLEKISQYHMWQSLNDKSKKSIAPARFYIDSHINENISVLELAKMCMLGESFFRRLFKKSTGMSPSQYKLQAKINKAQYILRSTEIAIPEVAESLGFCDVYYFYRCFTSITGTTPKQYREQKSREP